MIREVEIEPWGIRLRIDDAPQVLFLDCPEDISFAADAGLAKSVADARPWKFASASVLAARAKAFDDGLMAAVELAAAKGAGRFAGKEGLLSRLAAALGVGPGGTIAHGARQLGSAVAPPTAAAAETARRVAAFLEDERASKPLGFYSWSPALECVFRQDRFLQPDLAESEFAAVAGALHADPALSRGYQAWMRLNERLTNPFTRPDLRRAVAALEGGSAPAFERGVAIAPPSESPEGAVMKRLFGDAPIPEGFGLADRLIREIREGGVDLTPVADSGWYDRIVWSLETLAAPDRGPEAKKLELSKTYRDTLEALFKGILALARESHVKQLEHPTCGCAMPRPKLSPGLTVEPLPTHYLRRALGYRFVREVLESTFGTDTLRDLRRLTPDGPVTEPLSDELAAIEELFFGAHAVSCVEIGLEADPQSPSQASERFARWIDNLADDPDLRQDNRMMVPVFYDVERKRTKVWALLGWTDRPLSVGFRSPPQVEVLGVARSKGEFGFGLKPAKTRDVEFESARYSLVYPVTAEVYVTKLLNRDEFRAHCDRYRTQEEILANLR